MVSMGFSFVNIVEHAKNIEKTHLDAKEDNDKGSRNEGRYNMSH